MGKDQPGLGNSTAIGAHPGYWDCGPRDEYRPRTQWCDGRNPVVVVGYRHNPVTQG